MGLNITDQCRNVLYNHACSHSLGLALNFVDFSEHERTLAEGLTLTPKPKYIYIWMQNPLKTFETKSL